MKRNAVGGLVLDDGRESLVTSSGALLMNETIRVAGLRPALSRALRPWRPARARHDPGKVLLDVAIAVALGGDCVADVAADGQRRKQSLRQDLHGSGVSASVVFPGSVNDVGFAVDERH